MTNFTPGPWVVVLDDEGPYSAQWPNIYTNDLQREIVGNEGFYDEIQLSIANATLCAAAPDLYHALKIATGILISHNYDRVATDICTSVLEKAVKPDIRKV